MRTCSNRRSSRSQARKLCKRMKKYTGSFRPKAISDSCRTSSKASVLMGTILDGLDNSLRSEWNLSTFCSSHSVEQANNCSPFAFDAGFGVNPNPRGAVPVHWACPNFIAGVCVVIVNEDVPPLIPSHIQRQLKLVRTPLGVFRVHF